MLPMATPSTRKVTVWTVTPVGVLGVAVSTTMRFTVAPGDVTVIDEVVTAAAGGVTGVVGVVAGGVVVPVVLVVVDEEPELLVVLVEGVVAAAMAAAGVVALLPPQPARFADSAVMTSRTIGREQVSLKASYIADSPCKVIGPAFT